MAPVAQPARLAHQARLPSPPRGAVQPRLACFLRAFSCVVGVAFGAGGAAFNGGVCVGVDECGK